MKVPQVDVFAKGLLAWVIFVTLIVTQINKGNQTPFFRWGPNEGLILFYVVIDNYYKYIIVVLYTLMSTILRTLQSEILMPWIIQSVQNHNEKTEYVKKHAYEVVIIDGIYRWFDWFMYMNILLAQIDMMAIEVIGNLVISYLTTRYLYMKPIHVSALI